MRQVIRVSVSLCLSIASTFGAASAQTQATLDVDYMPEVEYDDGRDLLDVYMPEGTPRAPVLVFFHGGGLMQGDKGQGLMLARRLNPLGIGVVSANYRLSPSVQHPAHVQDAAAATSWVLESIGEYGGDSGRVFVSGHSAGAYLAVLLAIDSAHLKRHGHALSSIQGAIPISPFLYVEETAPSRPKHVWGEAPEAWDAASVTPHIGAGRRKMLLIYADGDDEWRREQNDRFGEAMVSAGSTNVRVIEVPDRTHNSLIELLTAPDDRIGPLIQGFVNDGR